LWGFIKRSTDRCAVIDSLGYNQTAGYVIQYAQNLTYVTIKDSGHMVMADIMLKISLFCEILIRVIHWAGSLI